MKHILASLNCEEALEVEKMSQGFVLEPGNETAEDSIEDLDHQDSGLDYRDSTAPLLASTAVVPNHVG